MECKVRFYQNNLWEVLLDGKVYFIGNLSDCYAWLKLSDDGYIDPSTIKPKHE